MHNLFKSFSQVDESITRSYGGSGERIHLIHADCVGLGLVISRDLAKLLGGDCSARSEYGEGSTFTFSFVVMSSPDLKTKYGAFLSPK